MLRLAVYPMQLIQLGWRIVYLHYTLCNGWQLQVSSASRLPLFRLARKVRISCYSCILNWMQLDYYAHICSDKKKDRCGMYPKKTLSAASLLSECERKRCRSLEARGTGDDETLLTWISFEDKSLYARRRRKAWWFHADRRQQRRQGFRPKIIMDIGFCHPSERERVFVGTAATCPFPMSEQSPRSIKLHQSVYARSNEQAQR